MAPSALYDTPTATVPAGKATASVPTVGKDAVPYESKWKRDTAVPLTKENLLDLLYGYTPTIREAGFLTQAECFEFEKELSPKLTPYKHNTGPLLQKVGIAQFEYQAQAEVDFKNRTNGAHITPFVTPNGKIFHVS